jgi:hypothetical protein
MLNRIVSMTPGARIGWIVTLDCGHTRFFESRPTLSQALCWDCDKKAKESDVQDVHES